MKHKVRGCSTYLIQQVFFSFALLVIFAATVSASPDHEYASHDSCRNQTPTSSQFPDPDVDPAYPHEDHDDHFTEEAVPAGPQAVLSPGAPARQEQGLPTRQLRAAREQLRNLYHGTMPPKFSSMLYQDQQTFANLEYTYLQPNDNQLHWVRVCRNESSSTTRGGPPRSTTSSVYSPQTNTRSLSDGAAPEQDHLLTTCDWYTTGAGSCNYGYHDRSRPHDQEFRFLENVLESNFSSLSAVKMEPFNNCEIPSAFAYNSSRLFHRQEHFDQHYGKALRGRFSVYLETLDWVYFGGGADTMLRQLYYCPLDAPVAILPVAKSGSNAAVGLVLELFERSLKREILAEFRGQGRRLKEGERFVLLKQRLREALRLSDAATLQQARDISVELNCFIGKRN